MKCFLNLSRKWHKKSYTRPRGYKGRKGKKMIKTRHEHTNYAMVAPFITATNAAEGHRNFESSGYMPLTVEKLYYNDCYGNPVYSITHYGEQNGDLMADPDMTIAFDEKNRRIIPQTYRNDYMGIYQEVFREINGKTMYSQSLIRQLDDFLWMWLKNINNQGFNPAV